MGKKRLPPGFRFHPTDVELVKYYLKRKVLAKRLHFEAIAEVDIYKYAPWELPDRSLMRTGDLKWYFFCPREKKYSSGSRMNRATNLGYWKTTGKDRPVHCNNEVVGMIKTLVFHRGKAPKGDRTDWVMYEYRLEEKDLSEKGVPQDSYVLCSIFKKDGPGPKNGAQYGAPFNEEEWDDDEEEVELVNCADVVSSATIPMNQNQSAVSGLLSNEALPSISNSVSVVADDHVASAEVQSVENDDLFAMLANFTDEIPPAVAQNNGNEVNNLNHGDNIGNNLTASTSDGFDIFEDLGDLGNIGRYNKPQDGISTGHSFSYSMEEAFGAGNDQFLELMDLDVPLSCCPDAAAYEFPQLGLQNTTSEGLLPGNRLFEMGESGSQVSFSSEAPVVPSARANLTCAADKGQASQPIQRGSFGHTSCSDDWNKQFH